jgi:hypothetical protein
VSWLRKHAQPITDGLAGLPLWAIVRRIFVVRGWLWSDQDCEDIEFRWSQPAAARWPPLGTDRRARDAAPRTLSWRHCSEPESKGHAPRNAKSAEAADLRMAASAGRRAADRPRPGQPPARLDLTSRYLLSGLGRCTLCGGSVIAMSRHHGRRRGFFYGCAYNSKRGPTRRRNNLHMPQEVYKTQ